MEYYVGSALFLSTSEFAVLGEKVKAYSENIEVQCLDIDEFLGGARQNNQDVEHLVLCAPDDKLKAAMEWGIERELSIGIIALPTQKLLIDGLQIPKLVEEQIELALSKNRHSIDLVRCNEEIVLVKTTIGRMPILDSRRNTNRWKTFVHALQRFRGIRLLGFGISTSEGRRIETASCGVVVAHPHCSNLFSQFVSQYGQSQDGMVSAVFVAPLSIEEYLALVIRALAGKRTSRKMPKSMGLIKSTSLTIDPDAQLTVVVDGHKSSRTPARIGVEANRLRLNTGADLASVAGRPRNTNEVIDIDNLPVGNEVARARKNRIPFFPYASEERFKELLIDPRKDAQINSAYVVLMILSTLLATTGLYLDSTSVVNDQQRDSQSRFRFFLDRVWLL